jgi:hypothetical protein
LSNRTNDDGLADVIINIQVYLPVSFKLVVKSQFSSRLNRTAGKDTDAHILANNPFLCDTVGITRMVDETSKTAFFCGINNLELSCG